MFKSSIACFSSNGMSGSPQASSLLELVRGLSGSLPDDVSQSLGSFDWAVRAHSVDIDGTRAQVRFFSDGLNLQAKLKVETAIREATQGRFSSFSEVGVFMERREKAVPAAAPTAANSGSTPAGASAPVATAATSAPAQSVNPAPTKPHSHEHKAPNAGKRGIAGVKRIIAVASGKGGVGKSTVSVNLALALHNQGYKVGILDADIYGPSLPMMLGLREDPSVNANNKIIPPERHGLKVMSFGFFAPDESAVIWRGPMVMKALQQFFYDVEWGELDFLVIDLPPGTGDAQLTLVQSLPLAGAVIVTTPQNVALLDAVKGVVMFRKTEVPILGVVENMSTFHCPSCGTESHIFGEGGADRVASKFDIPVLGHVPLIAEIRAAGDSGEPLATVSGHPIRVRFAEIAERVVKRVVELEKTPTTAAHIH